MAAGSHVWTTRHGCSRGASSVDHDGTQISLPGRLTKDVLMGPAARIIMSKAEYPEARVSKVVTFLKVSVSPERVTNRYLEIVPNVMGWGIPNVMGAKGESR